MNLVIGIPVTLLLIGHILLCLYLIGIILWKQSLRGQVSHWFILNAVISHLLYSAILRPGTINYEIEHLETAEAYCRIYNILHHVEQISVPAMLLMFTVDRMMYVQNPDTYGQKMTLPVTLVLLIFPWGLAVLVGLVTVYGFSADKMVVPLHEDDRNNTIVVCTHVETPSPFYIGMIILEAVLALIIALIALFVTVLVLCFFFRYKRAVSFNRAYSQLEAEVMLYVKDATVITCLLNLLYLMVFVTHFLLIELAAWYLDSHAVYFLFELFMGIIFLFLSTDIRRSTYHMCCKRNQQETGLNEETTLRYVASAEEAD